MIIGAHSVIYSTDPEADHKFLRDVLGLHAVDAGGGYLVFGLPSAEASVHAGKDDLQHELLLLCDDIKGFMAEMRKRKVRCSAMQDTGWGLLTQVTLPGGGNLGVYQPRHERPAARSEPRKQ
jgi:catechol 2,3-dioxygenase-like lactoylglutathione lyase family enzyme